MVRKIFKIFNREFGGLHKAALVLAVSSVVSAAFGLLRDRLLASTFGAGQSLDVYYAAFKIPDFIYIASLSLVSVNALIPLFLEKKSASGEEAKKFLNGVFTFFSLAVLIMAGTAYLAAPYLSGFVAPGFSPEASARLTIITRILLLSPILLGLSNLLSGVVQSYNKFFIYALSPIFYNIGIVLGIIFLAPRWDIYGVAAGVALGAFAHLAVQLPTIIKLGFMPKLAGVNLKEIFNLAKLSLPRTLGLGLNQIILLVITAAASLLGAGSIAVFNLSYNLQSVPLAVIGMSYSVAAFPTLAKLFVGNRKDEFLKYSSAAVRQIIFWSIPISALVIVLRAQIVRVIYGAGSFGWQDTRLTAAALALFAVSITSQSLAVLFIRAFYASGKTWKPIMANLVSAFLIIGLIPIFLKIFSGSDYSRSSFEGALRVSSVGGTRVLALPLAFSVGMIANSVMLFAMFEKNFGGVWSAAKKTLYQVLAASALMAAVSYFSLGVLDDVFDINTLAGISAQGALAAASGLAVWFYCLRLAGNKELEEVIASFANKFWKTKVVAPEPESLEK
ncbi:MAG: hypothetical protein L6Q29_01885 [Candidatus Pacebacteria bacterium]|nr:hypothetical protein [Candidatus Paceibacterota bacterium]NUQ56937.1 hypothetical protein [Candidatus Paceibacter sp.]